MDGQRPPCRVPFWYLTSMLVCLQLDVYRWLACRVAVIHIFEGDALLLSSGRFAVIRCTAVTVTQIPDCSIAAVSFICTTHKVAFGISYVGFFHQRPMLRTPGQAFRRTSPPQALLDGMTLHEYVQIHQFLDPLLPR